jgi:DNA-binding NarL/FixJ family response regulator
MPAQGPVQQADRLTFCAEALNVAAPGHAGEAQAREILAAFDAAAAAWEGDGQPYPLAAALLHAAEAALAASDRDAAAARLRRAAELADGLGARPLAKEIEALARSARIPPDGGQAGHKAAAATPLGLTAREFEVLRLVADGRSNPEIAARLFISAKTASVHVSNILAKIGVASRGEAAAAAHRLHLFDAVPAP